MIYVGCLVNIIPYIKQYFVRYKKVNINEARLRNSDSYKTLDGLDFTRDIGRRIINRTHIMIKI